MLATVLFTDIVDSTRRAAELGDSPWRALLDEHYQVARRAISRYGGREIKTIGDGVLATFDGPARACGRPPRSAPMSPIWGWTFAPASTRAKSSCEATDIAGLAVHIAARILAMASSGEVLVSGTVKDLVVGSGLEFNDRGSHVLKGVPGEWRVFALA